MWDSDRLFLFIEPTLVRLYRRQKRQIARLTDFTPDAAGLGSFAEWRAGEARLPITILTDLPDEGFVIEAIPRLYGAERRAVIRRKIQRHFPDTPYVAARTLPWHGSEKPVSEKPGRKEENLLLTSLPAQPLQDWLAAAKPLSGLYALPQLVEAAARKLNLPRDCIVLLRRGNFARQILLRAHVPCFSRLFSGNGENLLEETRRLLTYLTRQQPLQADLPLCPLFALSDSERELLATEFTLMPSIEADDAFFLSLLADCPPKTQYAPDELRQLVRAYGLSLFAITAGALCLAAGVGAYVYTEADPQETVKVSQDVEDEQMPEVTQEQPDVDEILEEEQADWSDNQEDETEPDGWQGLVRHERTGRMFIWKEDGLFMETENSAPEDIGGATIDLLRGGEVRKHGGRE
ncbi:MAG: hypothetical protein FWH15_01110 [Betaproteobacteria bacterium]|nr:hypothetical protein [Betaproteobacteria bacterium]